MKFEQVRAAKAEAKRFLQKVTELEEACKEAETDRFMNNPLKYGGKHTAALKRASMDLTRALSELRRS